MKTFFLVTFIFGIIASALPSEDASKPLNFIVFVDDDTEAALNQIKLSKKYLKSIGGDSTIIGKVEVIPTGNYNSTTFYKVMETKWKKWKKSEDNPTFAFDFTQGSYSSLLAKMFSRGYTFPMVSTSVDQNALTGLEVDEVDTYHNFTVQLRSPEKMIEELAVLISLLTSTQKSCCIVGNTLKQFRLDKMESDFYHRTRTAFFKEVDLSVTSANVSARIPAFIESHKIENIFTFGTTEGLQTLFKSASKRDLFDENHAWFAAISEIGGNFELPKYMDALMVLTLESNQTDLGKIMKNLNTKNIMDLFNVDVLVASLQTIQTMKRNRLWKDGDYKLDVRTPLTKYLEAGNRTILGKYVERKVGEEDPYRQGKPVPSCIWNPEIKNFKMQLIKSGNATFVGKFHFVGDHIKPEIINHNAFYGHFRTTHLRAIVVVDPPFVIKNNTCIAEEKKKKNGLSNKCYTGFVMDIFNMIRRELFFNWEIKSEDVYGEKQEKGKWTGARGALSTMQNKRRDVDIGIGAFTVYDEHDERAPEFSTESEPFYYHKERRAYYGFAFGGMSLRSGSKYSEAFNHMIVKLRNQRYLEHLGYRWLYGSKLQPNISSTH